jgi:hypothetical protein
MATVAIFLDSYEDTPDYDVLNKIICQWRKVEDETRAQCGMPSVYQEYPGCYLMRRGYDNITTPAGYDDTVSSRQLLRSAATVNGNDKADADASPPPPPRKAKALSPQDVLSRNVMSNNNGGKKHRILMDEAEFESDEDFDWDAFIQDVYAKEAAAAKLQQEQQHGRHLLDYGHVGWFNYFPLIGCKTEYYYRVSGTQTVPPCYARFDSGNNGAQNRGNTNHWRIMKDPIRISQRQLYELHRLIKDRIAPIDDPLRPCQPDTAAAPDPDGDPNKIWVARPLQETHDAHYETFCECKDWKSKWLEDQAWCQMEEQVRLFQQPYNYKTVGF